MKNLFFALSLVSTTNFFFSQTSGNGVTDIEGNSYSTVIIGDQEWMAENLRVGKFQNNDLIPIVTNGLQWRNTASSATCWYNNDSINNHPINGRLYNWYVVKDVRQVCPIGWRVPNDNDWINLRSQVSSIGFQNMEGKALKTTSGWINNGNGTDDLNFSARPSGFRFDDQNSTFFSINEMTYFWSTSSGVNYEAMYQKLESSADTIRKNDGTGRYGFSVRCLRDYCQTSIPTGSEFQNFCNSATVSGLSASGTTIQWYNAAMGGTVLPTNTPLVDGQTYYATQTENNCESQQRLAVTVTINSPAAPTGLTTQNFCNSATIGGLNATGTNINWYSVSTGGTPLTTSTALSNGMYYASQTINNCESQQRLAVNVTLFSDPNSNVSLNGNTLTASQQGATYQWLDCNNNLSPIIGANQVSYVPLVSGDYAVQVTMNGCSSTSACTFVQVATGSIHENGDYDSINLYPNPNTGTFIFETTKTGKYQVLNNLGQIITEFNVDYPSQNEVKLNNPAKGIYYIKHITNQTRPIQLIIN